MNGKEAASLQAALRRPIASVRKATRGAPRAAEFTNSKWEVMHELKWLQPMLRPVWLPVVGTVVQRPYTRPANLMSLLKGETVGGSVAG